jgi:methionyl-tRNA synthetase
MPSKIGEVEKSLGIVVDTSTYQKLIKNKELIGDTIITKIDALFPRIEDELIAVATSTPTLTEASLTLSCKNEKIKIEALEDEANLVTIDKFFETTLKIGTIMEAVEVPKSSKLLKLQVDLGEGRYRQILAGIKEYYSAESLIGTQACVVANLKPAKLMGMESEGMLLAAKDENGLHLLRPEAPKKSGTKVS